MWERITSFAVCRDRGKEGERKGRERGKEGEREGGREGRRERGKGGREGREGEREGREGGRDGRRKHYGNIMVKLTLALLSDTHLFVVQKTRITFQHCVSGMPSSQMMPTTSRERKTQTPEHAHMPLQLPSSVPAHWPHPLQTHHRLWKEESGYTTHCVAKKMDYFALKRVLQLCHLAVVTTLDLSSRGKKQVSQWWQRVWHIMLVSANRELWMLPFWVKKNASSLGLASTSTGHDETMHIVHDGPILIYAFLENKVSLWVVLYYIHTCHCFFVT